MVARYRDPFYTPEPENQHIINPKARAPRNEETTRDQNLQIQTLYYTAGLDIDAILLQFSLLTRDQVDYALETRPTPQKNGHCGRPVKLSTPQRKELVKWATTDSLTRDVPWAEIHNYLPDTNAWCGVGAKAIRRAFKLEDYVRCVQRRKPPSRRRTRS